MKLAALDLRRLRRPPPERAAVAVPVALPAGGVPSRRSILNVTVVQSGRTLVLVVEGDVDQHAAPTMGEALESALARRPWRLVVDLSEVRFLNSAGLEVLLRGDRKAAPHTDLRLVATSRATWRPLQITRLHEQLVIHASRASAIAAPAREHGRGADG